MFTNFKPGMLFHQVIGHDGPNEYGMATGPTWEFVGETRHPYAGVFMDTVHRTTCHIAYADMLPLF